MAQHMSAETARAYTLVREVLSTGPVTDPLNGRATSIIAETAGLPIALVSQVLKGLDARGVILRHIVGKRTLLVRLLTEEERIERIKNGPPRQVPKERAPGKIKPLDSAAARTPISSAPDKPTPPVQSNVHVLRAVESVVHDHELRHPSMTKNAPSGVNHAELAAEILRQAIDAAAGPGRVAAELRDALNRLGEQTAESQRLRTKVRTMEDELRAARHEVDGLRTRAQQAERNLARVLQGGMLDVDREKELRGIMSLMRPTVASTKARDDERQQATR